MKYRMGAIELIIYLNFTGCHEKYGVIIDSLFYERRQDSQEVYTSYWMWYL